jgi:hypothetical protein
VTGLPAGGYAYGRDEVAHRVVYRWADNLLGTSDLGPVASSLAMKEVVGLHEVVGHRVRMTDAGEVARPPVSLCHLRVGDERVALRRQRGGDENRDDVAEVIVGPRHLVTPRFALAIADWPPPSVYGAEILMPVEHSQIERLTMVSRQRLAQGARAAGPQLAALVAAMLRAPTASLAVLARGGWTGHLVRPEELMWGLLDIMGKVGAGLDHSDWTFSTYEAEHHDGLPELPRIVFAPDATRQSRYGMSRVAVHPLVPVPHDDHAGRASRQLVDWYVAADSYLASQLDRMGLRRYATLEERVAAVVAAPVGAPARPRVAPLPSEHRQREPLEPAVAVSAPATQLRGAPSPVPSTFAQEDPLPPTYTVSAPVLDLVYELGRVDTADTVARVVEALGQQANVGPPGARERQMMRDELVPVSFHWKKLYKMFGPDAVRPLEALVRVAVVPDLGVPEIRWTFLGQRELEPAVAHVIARCAIVTGHHERLLMWLGVRWLADAGMTVPEPAALPDERPAASPRRRIVQLLRALSNPDARRIATVIAGGVLVLALLMAVYLILW